MALQSSTASALARFVRLVRVTANNANRKKMSVFRAKKMRCKKHDIKTKTRLSLRSFALLLGVLTAEPGR
jgi:hypothetical protein